MLNFLLQLTDCFYKGHVEINYLKVNFPYIEEHNNYKWMVQ